MSVSTNPGATALTVMPRAATSRANDFVRPITPALAAAYAACPAFPISACGDRPDGLLGCRLVGEVVDHHLRAGGRERQRGRATDATRRPGHDSDLTVELAAHARSSRARVIPSRSPTGTQGSAGSSRF